MRISFVGGATDIENYYSKYGGEVVSCAINKYIYVTLNKRDDDKIVVSYTKTESVDTVEQVQHEIVREALKMAEITKGIEIHIIANISTIGTGLGGSSAVAVGVLKALFPDKTNYDIAGMACELEIKRLGKCIGKQDQYACAMGGLNHILFHEEGEVDIEGIENIDNCINERLQNKMFLVKINNNGFIRRAETILKHQNDLDNTETLHKIKYLCNDFHGSLFGKSDMEISRLINHYWRLKRTLSDYVSNKNIDNIINLFIFYGCGAKLCGAGQSGFIFVYDPSGITCKGIPVEIDYEGCIITQL
ncbi:MAG: GHMP kinase [Candidatus Nanoarchaeia archaeon]|nr:GHMP kinase [Candidatus Nanoarchaeia archaeon]